LRPTICLPFSFSNAMSAKIAALRETVQLTQRQLAERVGVTETTIANWEQGRSGLDWISRLGRLCRALDCSLEALIQVTETGVLCQITQLRERQNLTQRQLAERVGVTETTIANWERGRSGLDWIERLIRLCFALNCQITDLVDLSSLPPSPSVRPSLAELLGQQNNLPPDRSLHPETRQTSG
jgi:transcriptional regulator with XRE-family HTH domain